jgi:ATP-dependent protease ClpP protease subunit
MRVPVDKAGQDWCRFVNKSKEEDLTEVYIYDEIGFWGTSASDFVKKLNEIDTSKILLHLNSPGGEVFDGIAIYNALKEHPASVTVTVDALAASAASFIAQAGDTILMTSAATMMIHDAIAFAYGNAGDMRSTADILDKLSNNVAGIYQANAGGTVPEWRATMQEEAWYNAEEAVAAGLASAVSGTSDDKVENKFELLTFFNHTSRSSAPSPDQLRRQVLNRVKEAHMGKSAGTEGTPKVEVTPSATVTEPVTEPVTPVTEPVQMTGQLVTGQSFKMGSDESSDPIAVQKYIDTLEGFQRETVNGYRKQFVQSLATGDSPKIGAPQVEKLETFALSLSNEQYKSWVASWDAAPGLALLGSHAAGGRDGGEVTATKDAAKDQIEVALAIVDQHKRSGMAPESIKNTASYKTVIQNDPKFTL